VLHYQFHSVCLWFWLRAGGETFPRPETVTVKFTKRVVMSESDKVIMFRARDSSWQKPLVRLEVERVSDSSVWLRGSRVARSSEGTRICHDFQTAKQWLEGALRTQIEQHQRAIDALEKRLEAIVATTEDAIPDDDSRY
jgi:hypothetical protein